MSDLELIPEPDSCEASPFIDWPCPERFNLEWRLDAEQIDGVFFFGEPAIGADGEPVSVWHRCDPVLLR